MEDVKHRKSIMDKIKKNVSLSGYTTFKVGGPADYLVEIVNEFEFKEAIQWAIERDIRYFILGKGSNVLFSDDGYRGLIIYTGGYKRIFRIDNRIIAEAGAMIDELIDYATDNSLTGLEFLAGLPGSVGGAVYMNARAYGGEISRVITEGRVLIVDEKDKKIKEAKLNREAMDFSYKKSIFQSGNIYLMEAVFYLKKGNPLEIKEKISEIRTLRKSKGEYLFPNAGCIFKNDYSAGKSTGRIIDECGLKGMRVGKAEVYEKHANFIINKGGANASDIYKLINFIEEEVIRKTGIKLQKEIVLVGFDQ